MQSSKKRCNVVEPPWFLFNSNKCFICKRSHIKKIVDHSRERREVATNRSLNETQMVVMGSALTWTIDRRGVRSPSWHWNKICHDLCGEKTDHARLDVKTGAAQCCETYATRETDSHQPEEESRENSRCQTDFSVACQGYMGVPDLNFYEVHKKSASLLYSVQRFLILTQKNPEKQQSEQGCVTVSSSSWAQVFPGVFLDQWWWWYQWASLIPGSGTA